MQRRALRIRDVGAYLGVSHRRADQMFHEGWLPEPDPVDGIGPLSEPATDERWAERDWWGHRSTVSSWTSHTACLILASATHRCHPFRW
jgi:hypothetical protein